MKVMKAHVADRVAAFPQCFQPVPPPSPPPPSPRPSPPPPMPRPPPSPVPTSGSWTVPVLVTALPYTSTVVSVRWVEGGWLRCRSLHQHAACSAAVFLAAWRVMHGFCTALRSPHTTAGVFYPKPFTKERIVCCHPLPAVLQGWISSGQVPMFCNDTATPLDKSGTRLAPRGIKVFR